jgi:NDP-sugar pyrophosphorylase family protein
MPDLPDGIILCGGAGVRLRSITGNAPKAMASIGGRPFLELLLRQLHRYRFRRVVLAVGFRQDMIRRHFGERACGLDLAYSPEASPLGTGGALRNAADLVESDLALIMNGDSYTDADLSRFVADHREAKADVSLIVTSADGRGDCGSVYVNRKGYVERFAEKQNSAGAPYVNAGIYIMPRRLLHSIPPGLPVSLEQDLFPRWLEEGYHLKACVFSGMCVDIGTPDRYHRAQDILANVEMEPCVPNCEGTI